MSFDLLFSSIYRLYYKADVRAAFLADGTLPDGLSESEACLLKSIDGLRLERIVELHGNDIWAGWYANRLGATWEALRVLLGAANNGALVGRLCQSAAFEKRVNDDRDGAALWGFINEERKLSPETFERAPWLDDLFQYEAMLSQQPAAEDTEFKASLGAFAWRVDQIVELPRPWSKLPKRKGVAAPYLALFGVCPTYGVSEVEIADDLMLGVLSRLLGSGLKEEQLLAGANKRDLSELESEAHILLEEMRGG